MAQSVKLKDGSYIDASGVWDEGSALNAQAALAALRASNAGKQDFIEYIKYNQSLTLDIDSNHDAWLVVDYEYGSTGIAANACICIITSSYSYTGSLLDIAGTKAATTGISITSDATNHKITVAFKGYHTGRIFVIR